MECSVLNHLNSSPRIALTVAEQDNVTEKINEVSSNDCLVVRFLFLYLRKYTWNKRKKLGFCGREYILNISLSGHLIGSDSRARIRKAN